MVMQISHVLHLNFITLFKWPSTINVKNFVIFSFTWLLYWAQNRYFKKLHLFHGLKYYCNMMQVLFSF